MPIKAENKKRYPKNWKEIRGKILRRANNRCEFCGIENHAMRDGKKIVLTIAHLDHIPENCDEGNLRALCQRCHNRYDAPHRAETRKQSKKMEALKLEEQIRIKTAEEIFGKLLRIFHDRRAELKKFPVDSREENLGLYNENEKGICAIESLASEYGSVAKALNETETNNKKMSFAEYLKFWGFEPLNCCDGCSWRRECFEIETREPCKEYKEFCGFGEEGGGQ